MYGQLSAYQQCMSVTRISDLWRMSTRPS